MNTVRQMMVVGASSRKNRLTGQVEEQEKVEELGTGRRRNYVSA